MLHKLCKTLLVLDINCVYFFFKFCFGLYISLWVPIYNNPNIFRNTSENFCAFHGLSVSGRRRKEWYVYMKFIFPQNYHFKNKILGVIDYTTAFVNLLWYVFVFFIVNFLFRSLNVKIFVFIIFCFPLLLFSIAGFNGENIITVIKYMFKFFFGQKIFFFSKIKKKS